MNNNISKLPKNTKYNKIRIKKIYKLITAIELSGISIPEAHVEASTAGSCNISGCFIKTRYLWFYKILSLLSVFVGSFGGLRQKKLKTLLAYSSVSHMGYVLLSFSTGTQFGIEMLLLDLVIYMLSCTAVWFIVLAVREKKQLF
jgi:NADH:ubiquinone oxidoreductase subunit 4 (subunit M)